MKLNFELTTKIVDGKRRLVMEDRKTDAVSVARYNKEDIERKQRIEEQTAYIKECSKIDRSKLSFRYRG